MNKKGHSVGAAIVSALTIYYMKDDLLTELITISGVVIGSFVPDIDAEYSTFNKKCPIIPKIFKIIQKILPDNPITSHRGALFHSILTLIPFAIFYKVSFVLGMGLGILGHHLLDMTTPAGLRYFFPYKIILRIWRS
jgi:membrane-bound metal-dependent hydrolase YbcI (DUF457 family)